MSNTPKLEVVPPEGVDDPQLDADEAEFRAMRRDLPGVKGASVAGMVTLAVGKTPGKNEFFRAKADFHPIVPIVNIHAPAGTGPSPRASVAMTLLSVE
jgi:hypothetical protein